MSKTAPAGCIVCVVLTVNTLREVFYEAQACAVTQEVNRHYKHSYYYMSGR